MIEPAGNGSEIPLGPIWRNAKNQGQVWPAPGQTLLEKTTIKVMVEPMEKILEGENQITPMEADVDTTSNVFGVWNI